MRDFYFKLLIPGIPYKNKNGGFGYASISVIRDGRDNILFDVGHYAVREKIMEIIKKFKINKVFISHLHYDHCLNIDLFLNKGITIYLNRKEWEYIKRPRANDIYTFRFFNKIVKRQDLTLFERQLNISNNVTAIETVGHTAGHSSLIFVKNGKSYILAGDAIKTDKDFKNPNLSDVEPYDLKRFITTKKYIIDNFDIIVPGHANIIREGKSDKNNLVLTSF